MEISFFIGHQSGSRYHLQPKTTRLIKDRWKASDWILFPANCKFPLGDDKKASRKKTKPASVIVYGLLFFSSQQLEDIWSWCRCSAVICLFWRLVHFPPCLTDMLRCCLTSLVDAKTTAPRERWLLASFVSYPLGVLSKGWLHVR